MVKNLPAVQETWVQSLGWEDPLEEGTATYSSVLAWRIPWTEEPGGLQPPGLRRVGTTERLNTKHQVFSAGSHQCKRDQGEWKKQNDLRWQML